MIEGAAAGQPRKRTIGDHLRQKFAPPLPFRFTARRMITLAIETSTSRGSVAVCAGGELIFEQRFSADRSHSASLFAALEKACAVEKRPDQVAVGLGPGSYAGVRIAIAAALGLELGLGANLVGLPSVAGLEVEESRYLAIGDARRETFYFTAVENGVCLEGPRLGSEMELREWLEQFSQWPVYTCEVLPLSPQARVAVPSAKILAQLAQSGRGVVQTGDLEPIYLRDPHITQPKSATSLPAMRSSAANGA